MSESVENTGGEVTALRQRVRQLEAELAAVAIDQPLDGFAHLERLATVGEFCAEMAHEVGSPLGAIRNFGESAINLLETGAHDCLDDVKTSIATIVAQASRAQQISRRVHGYARPSEGDRSPLDLHDLINDVLPLIEMTAEKYAIQIEVEADDDLPPLNVNRVQIEQVFVNLLRNALEAVATCEREHRRVVVRVSHDERTVEVAIQDAGEGIADEDFHRLFNRFFSTKREGTGLGLSISKAIIESHGGRIWVASNEGRGVTFYFTLQSDLP